MSDYTITGTIHHQTQTRTGTILIASRETELNFNLEMTDMYQLTDSSGSVFYFPAIGSVVHQHDL